MKNAVGPVLRMSEDIEAILAAIEDDNPGTAIEVIDRGAYVRIQAERHMSLRLGSMGNTTSGSPSIAGRTTTGPRRGDVMAPCNWLVTLSGSSPSSE